MASTDTAIATETKRAFDFRVAASRAAAYLTPARAVWVILLLGGLLRFYGYDRLSLWLDEGFTVIFSRLLWDVVLGLHGAYDPHPPLYYALVKLVTLVAPEVVAARLLSVVAGTLTIPVVYLLGRRLFSPWAGVVASAGLAFSPLHVWYSQEGRQYALAVLLVALSYYSLLSFYREPSLRWAVLYGVSTLLSMYVDYSPIYALVPQLVPLAIVLKEHGRRALPVFIAGALAVIAYLPWLPQLLATGRIGDQSRASYLGASETRVYTSIRSILGFAENGSFFVSNRPATWQMWALAHDLLLVAVLVTALLGLVLLWRRSPIGLIVVTCLSIGTIVVAIGMSLISPGYADRTVLYAVVGWALLLGALASYSLSGWLSAVRWFCLACVALVFAVSLFTVYTYGDKQHWRELAHDTASAAASGHLVLTYPGPAPVTLVGVYEPQALSGRHIALEWPAELPTIAAQLDQQRDSVIWLSYLDFGDTKAVHDWLSGLGYERVSHIEHFRRLYLDMYVRPDTLQGTELPVNGTFTGEGRVVDPWQLPTDGVEFSAAGAGRELMLTSGGEGERSAYAGIGGQPNAVYVLQVEARSELQKAEGFVARLWCTSERGEVVRVGPDPGGASVPNDAAWHTIRVGVQCPAENPRLTIALHNFGPGRLTLRNVKLLEVTPGR